MREAIESGRLQHNEEAVRQALPSGRTGSASRRNSCVYRRVPEPHLTHDRHSRLCDSQDRNFLRGAFSTEGSGSLLSPARLWSGDVSCNQKPICGYELMGHTAVSTTMKYQNQNIDEVAAVASLRVQ